MKKIGKTRRRVDSYWEVSGIRFHLWIFLGTDWNISGERHKCTKNVVHTLLLAQARSAESSSWTNVKQRFESLVAWGEGGGWSQWPSITWLRSGAWSRCRGSSWTGWAIMRRGKNTGPPSERTQELIASTQALVNADWGRATWSLSLTWHRYMHCSNCWTEAIGWNQSHACLWPPNTRNPNGRHPG